MDRGLREGCPSSPPFFNAYHMAVMRDFRARRLKRAGETGHEVGLNWRYKMDSELSLGEREKRRSEDENTREGRHSKQRRIGDVLFADDTAVIAHANEYPEADSCMKATMQDWEEKCNEDKKELLVLEPGKELNQRAGIEYEKEVVKHVGVYLQEDGEYARDTTTRAEKARARIFALKTAWATKGGRKYKLNRATRLRTLKAVVTPALTTYCKTRPWIQSQLRKLAKVQNLAVRIGYGIDIRAMRANGISHAMLHKAAGWTPVATIIKKQTLMWLGHVSRMHPERLPKQALFGWIHGELQDDRGTRTQTGWLRSVLHEARIPERDWFRLAQQKGNGGLWKWLVDRAFPNGSTYQGQSKRPITWKPGNALPAPPKRRKKLHKAITPGCLEQEQQADRLSCPACGQAFPNQSQLQAHYKEKHEVVDASLAKRAGNTFHPITN